MEAILVGVAFGVPVGLVIGKILTRNYCMVHLKKAKFITKEHGHARCTVCETEFSQRWIDEKWSRL